ncbi:branched-chain amino acid ABC transporter permease (plasmid) [Rhizobium sp. RCAM05350]|nr:branched-chain amino acid ABC transporter permease [Rhizobium sp. RCAM05350]
MDAIVLIQGMNILYTVLALALVMMGLAIVMGLLNVLNIVHGEFIMIGAFTAYAVQAAGWPYILSVPAVFLVCGALGLVVERLLIRPLRYDPFDTLLATWGLGLLLRKFVEMFFGRAFRSVQVPLPGSLQIAGHSYPTYRIMIMAISAALLVSLVIWFRKTRTGSRIRAMVGNPTLAEAVGISTVALARNTFVAGTILAGFAGVVIAPLVPIEPQMGITLVVNAFFMIIIGGLGTVVGLIGGATMIGGIQSAVSAVFDPTTAYLSILALSVLFLWRWPRGIFPRV